VFTIILYLQMRGLHLERVLRLTNTLERTARTKRYRPFLCVVFSSFVSFIFPSDQVWSGLYPINLPLCAIKAEQKSFSLENSLWKTIIAYQERMKGSCKHLSINRCVLDIVCFLANKEAEKR
jgi:hypothetical protein